MQSGLAKTLEQLKAGGALTQASILIKEFDRGEWTALNAEEQYHPASLMKVVLLLGYLRFAENTPDLFEQKWLFDKAQNYFQEFPQYYSTPSIEPGKVYTVHELLYYMVAHSDNNATWMLASRLDKSHLQKIFAEFGMKAPAEFDMRITMNVREYSTFFNAIYNASNLSPEYADYAADLLSNCSFQEGFSKGFPPQTHMWHKFGQWKSSDLDHELHESGIVYLKGKPYLITIMTRGKDTDRLAGAIQAICKQIYDGVPAP
jgi:beta-lactamase class A